MGKYLVLPKVFHLQESFIMLKVYAEWRSGSITAKVAMQKTGLKRTSFYKLVQDKHISSIGFPP